MKPDEFFKNRFEEQEKQDTRVPSCENSGLRRVELAIEAGLNSVQPLQYYGKEFCHFEAQWSRSLPVPGSLKSASRREATIRFKACSWLFRFMA